MSNSDNKLSKTNGLGTDPLQRLASIKPPRDYTLGAAKANKKVFTPNLNVTRNKNKGPATTNASNNKKEDKKRERKNDKNRNNRHGPDIIKGAGVFSEGAASAQRQSGRMSFGRNTEPAPALQRPVIRVKDVVTIDKELEEQKIQSVMGQENVTDEVDDFKRSIETDAPIKLPMDDIGWSLNKVRGTKVKQEVQIKVEPDEDGMMPVVEKKPIPGLKKEVYEDEDLADLLKNDQPTLVLIKLPDGLPGRVARVEDDIPRRKTAEPATSSQGSSSVPINSKCNLRSLEEGRIGKLQIHRSGRVSLRLGDTAFEVSLGTKSAYHQEVVAITTNETARSADMVSLGSLHHKISIIPDWENMFLEMAS